MSLNLYRADAQRLELERHAAAGRPAARGGKPRPARIQEALSVRLADEGDRTTVEQLAELDSATVPCGRLLIGMVGHTPAAALSLVDGRVVANPFTPTRELIALMRLRARQLEVRRGPVRRTALAPLLLVRRTSGRRV